MCIHLQFNYKKAVQALNFFAEKSGGKINKMKALKLVYFAERFHIRKFCRPITNDEYWAMPYGPVASSVKDIAEMSDFLGEEEMVYAKKYIQPNNSYDVASIKTFDRGPLSESDIEALCFSLEKFGGYNQYELAEITHKYPEWKKHSDKLKNTTRVRMDYSDFLNDPDNSHERCFDLNDRGRETCACQLKELSKIEAYWD